MTGEMLYQRALRARAQAYAPYSHFTVGAALLSDDGRVFDGCNIENSAYTPTCCAERVALFSAIAAGARRFTAIAIAGGPAGQVPTRLCPPCGVCRQALCEFVEPGAFTVWLGDGTHLASHTLAELLPLAFHISETAEK